MNRLKTISLTLMILVLTPLAAVAVGYHYTNFNIRLNTYGQAVSLKSTPATLHTVSVNFPTQNGNCSQGCSVFLLDTNASQCTNTLPPTAPLIAEIYTYGPSGPGWMLTYDVTTKTGLCVVYHAAADVTIAWN
jgi:hypothetical protein